MSLTTEYSLAFNHLPTAFTYDRAEAFNDLTRMLGLNQERYGFFFQTQVVPSDSGVVFAEVINCMNGGTRRVFGELVFDFLPSIRITSLRLEGNRPGDYTSFYDLMISNLVPLLGEAISQKNNSNKILHYLGSDGKIKQISELQIVDACLAPHN